MIILFLVMETCKRDYDLNSELYQGVHKLEYYDEIISKNNADYNYENNLKLVLEREFVNRVGFWAIQDAVSKGGEDIINVINWLKNDSDVFRTFYKFREIKKWSYFVLMHLVNYIKTIKML